MDCFNDFKIMGFDLIVQRVVLSAYGTSLLTYMWLYTTSKSYEAAGLSASTKIYSTKLL